MASIASKFISERLHEGNGRMMWKDVKDSLADAQKQAYKAAKTDGVDYQSDSYKDLISHLEEAQSLALSFMNKP